MKSENKQGAPVTYVVIGLAVILFILAAWMMLPNVIKMFNNELPASAIGYPGGTYRALVQDIIEEGEIMLGERQQQYQVFIVEVLQGPYQGSFFEMDYGRRQLIPDGFRINRGDKIMVWVEENPMDGSQKANFIDFYRIPSILALFGLFVLVSVLVSGRKGIRGLFGIGFGLLVIVFYVIPNILDGRDPIWISITGSLFFLAVSLYIVYGWNMKTHSAVIGTAVSLLITGLIAFLSVNLTRLTGFGDENAMFLVQAAPENLNISGLLLAGILIGSLGVLDDLVIGQSSAVFELNAANSLLGFRMLYRRAMNIGRDHVAATVNTLVLAYTGAALPMLLLFSLSSQNYGQLFNMSMIAEEVVRTLVGSIGLFLAVPLTTMIASLLATNHHRLGPLQRFLGPKNAWESDSVFHSH